MIDDDDDPDLFGESPLTILGWIRPRWHAEAACREHPDVSWFPDLGKPAAPAKAICATCLVSAECHAASLLNEERGIWGGTSERDRRRTLGAA